MKKPQYITIFVAIAALVLLWAFGNIKPGAQAHSHEGHQHDDAGQPAAGSVSTSSFSIDSALNSARGRFCPPALPGWLHWKLLVKAGQIGSKNSTRFTSFHSIGKTV
ncbi:hypothetical protein LWM68_38350 [Niabella sp. W65]|nr:hypothetical protein [Niabella sp. W65]MCH7368086.1 hypothetical protein [Niabella sp. W65]